MYPWIHECTAEQTKSIQHTAQRLMDLNEIHRCWSSSTSPAAAADRHSTERDPPPAPLASRRSRRARRRSRGRVSLVTRAAALVAAGRPRHAPARAARCPPQPPRAAPAAAQSREPRRSPPTLVATRAPPVLPAAAALGPRQPPRATGARAPLSAARATGEGAQVSDAMEDGPGVQSGVRGVRESSSVEGRGAGERHRMPHQRGPASGKLPLRAARSTSCLPALLAPHSTSCC